MGEFIDIIDLFHNKVSNTNLYQWSSWGEGELQSGVNNFHSVVILINYTRASHEIFNHSEINTANS